MGMQAFNWFLFSGLSSQMQRVASAAILQCRTSLSLMQEPNSISFDKASRILIFEYISRVTFSFLDMP